MIKYIKLSLVVILVFSASLPVDSYEKGLRLYNQKKSRKQVKYFQESCQAENMNACFNLGMGGYLDTKKDPRSCLRRDVMRVTVYPVIKQLILREVKDTV